jgi:hypothetical protein
MMRSDAPRCQTFDDRPDFLEDHPMQNRVSVSIARLTLALAVSALLTVGPIGCGDSTPSTGTTSEVAPEVKKANESMENFMKNQQKK